MSSAGATPKRDDVHQRIELRAEPGAGVAEAGDPAVQHVEDPGEHDEPSRPSEVPVEGGHDGPEPEEQVAERERARHDDDDLAHRGPAHAFPAAYQLHSATTVMPAWVRSPDAHQHAGADRQEEVYPRAEPDHAQPLALAALARPPGDR